MLAQLGDVDIHGAGIEIVVVDPDGLQGEVALQDLVGVAAEQGQELVLLRGELGLLLADGEQLLLGVEGELTDAVYGRLLGLLALRAAQDGLNTEHELLHGEGFGDIVVGTNLEAFEDILLKRLGGQEDDGHVGIGRADLLCEGEAVFLGHHHVEHTDVELGLQEGLEACIAIGAELSDKAFCLQILTKQHSEVFVILTKQDFQLFFHNRSL